MNDVYYSVEPYTGDIICHYGIKDMAWGFSKGVANGLRTAVGKLNPQTGQYIYDTAKYIGNRLRNGELGSRTIAKIRSKVGSGIRKVRSGLNKVRNKVGSGINKGRDFIANRVYDSNTGARGQIARFIGTNDFDTYADKTDVNRAKEEQMKKLQNAQAKRARTDYLNKNGKNIIKRSKGYYNV